MMVLLLLRDRVIDDVASHADIDEVYTERGTLAGCYVSDASSPQCKGMINSAEDDWKFHEVRPHADEMGRAGSNMLVRVVIMPWE